MAKQHASAVLFLSSLGETQYFQAPLLPFNTTRVFFKSLIKVNLLVEMAPYLTWYGDIWREHNFHRETVQTGKTTPSQSGMNAGERGGHSKGHLR